MGIIFRFRSPLTCGRHWLCSETGRFGEQASKQARMFYVVLVSNNRRLLGRRARSSDQSTGVTHRVVTFAPTPLIDTFCTALVKRPFPQVLLVI